MPITSAIIKAGSRFAIGTIADSFDRLRSEVAIASISTVNRKHQGGFVELVAGEAIALNNEEVAAGTSIFVYTAKRPDDLRLLTSPVGSKGSRVGAPLGPLPAGLTLDEISDRYQILLIVFGDELATGSGSYSGATLSQTQLWNGTEFEAYAPTSDRPSAHLAQQFEAEYPWLELRIVEVAQAGSSFTGGQWASGGALREQLLTEVQGAIAAINRDFYLWALLGLQSEETGGNYESELIALTSQLRNEVDAGLPLVPAIAGSSSAQSVQESISPVSVELSDRGSARAVGADAYKTISYLPLAHVEKEAIAVIASPDTSVELLPPTVELIGSYPSVTEGLQTISASFLFRDNDLLNVDSFTTRSLELRSSNLSSHNLIGFTATPNVNAQQIQIDAQWRVNLQGLETLSVWAVEGAIADINGNRLPAQQIGPSFDVVAQAQDNTRPEIELISAYTELTQQGKTIIRGSFLVTDNTAIQAVSISASSLQLSGRNMTSFTRSPNSNSTQMRIDAEWVLTASSGDGLVVRATENGIRDTSGNAIAPQQVGPIITVQGGQQTDASPPIVLNGSYVSVESVINQYDFEVDYLDDVAIAVNSLGAGVTVVGPRNYSRQAIFLGASSAANTKNVTGRYRLTAPFTGAINNGTYTILVSDGAVKDTSGNQNLARSPGSFVVAIADDSQNSSDTTPPYWGTN